MSQAASINDVFALVAIGVPEFAGVHVDEQQDTVYVHLRNGTPGMAQTVLAQLRSFFGEHTLPQHKMQVMSAGFTFSELKRWHDQIIVNVLDHPGVTFIGIDHANNRVVIGVESSTVRSLLEPEVARQGIPPDAVNFLETGPIKFSRTLRNEWRPVVGGIQIGIPAASHTCTLGFNALRFAGSGLPPLGFVTASHCSGGSGIVGTEYTQGGNRVGIETVDAQYHRCFLFFRCRSSDSAFVQLDPGVSADIGVIAMPAGSESIEWDGESAFLLEGGGTPFSGLSVTKVGKTTGRTDGTVLFPGVTFREGRRRLLEDQVLTILHVDSGDSGSPVIHITGTDSALLEGIVVAKSSFDNFSFFSRISAIQGDIGPLEFELPQSPDLIAVSPPGAVNFCASKAPTRVLVRLANIGNEPANASKTKIEFPGFGPIPPDPDDNPTPMIPPGGFYDIPPIAPPAGCFNPDCDFVITVDVDGSVAQGATGQANKTVTGSCPGAG
jgi:hypothetical protein